MDLMALIGSNSVVQSGPPLTHVIFLNMIASLIAIVVIWVSYFFFRTLLNHHVSDVKARFQWRNRLFYTLLTITLIIIARIWISGMQQILTLLSIIAAALTLTQKETIMNFVGCLLIYWRKLFKPGHRIKIMQYYGDVSAIGLFYFTLIECDANYNGDQTTGRVIKVPNGMVITSAVTNLSEPFPFVWNEFSVALTLDSDLELAKKLLLEILEPAIDKVYQDAKSYLDRYAETHFTHEPQLKTKFYVLPKLDKPIAYVLTSRFLCNMRDEKEIKNLIWEQFLAVLTKNPTVQLAYAS